MNIVEGFEFAKQQLEKIQSSFAETDRVIAEMQLSVAKSIESIESIAELEDEEEDIQAQILFRDMKFYEEHVSHELQESFKYSSHTLEEYVNKLFDAYLDYCEKMQQKE